MSRKPKVKWTFEINKDVLECKRKAQELVTSDRNTVDENGRKKGYKLYRSYERSTGRKGYGHLGLKSQNLRHQASKLEKIQEGSVDISLSISRAMSKIDEPMYAGGTESASNIDHSDSADLFNLDVQMVRSDESRYANSQDQQEVICI